MKRYMVGVLAGSLFLVFASQHSFAQMRGPVPGSGGCFQEGMPMKRHDGMGMRGRRHHFGRILAGLGLDEKQMAAVREIRNRAAKDTVRKRADLQIARIDLRAILAGDRVDLSAAEAGLKKIASLQTDIRLAHIKALQDIKALLTPEQRKKFKEMRERPFAGKAIRGAGRMNRPAGEKPAERKS